MTNVCILDGKTQLCHAQCSSTPLSHSMVKHTFIIPDGQSHLCHTQW
jgi:hypothetical protein